MPDANATLRSEDRSMSERYDDLLRAPWPELVARVRELLESLEPRERAPALIGMAKTSLMRQRAENLLAAFPDVFSERAELGARRARARIEEVAADEPTRRVLLELVPQTFDSTQTCLEPLSGERVMVALRVGSEVVRLELPLCWTTFFVFRQIFLDEGYAIDRPVEQIYDLGANVGMSALYLWATLRPRRVVCVEPMAHNCELLRANLARNGVEHEVIEAAVAPDDGEVLMHVYGPDLHSMASTAWRKSAIAQPEGTRSVAARSLSSLIDLQRPFGVKMDIEGTEHELRGAFGPLAHAEWIVGDLHYVPGTSAEANGRFVRELQACFDVSICAPRVSEFSFTVNKDFRAHRRGDAAAASQGRMR